MSYSHTNSKGVTYYLYCADVKLLGGKEQRIYYFAKNEQVTKGTPCELPDGYVVRENPRNGFLTVTRIRKEYTL